MSGETGVRWLLPGVKPDPLLTWTTGLLLGLGLVMVASTSFDLAVRDSGSPFHYLMRQSMFLAVGLTAGLVAFKLASSRLLAVVGPLLLIPMGLLLAALLIPGFGHEANGSVRWLDVGPVNIQLSELAKLVVIVYVAGYLERHHGRFRDRIGVSLGPVLVVGVIAGLIFAEPDLGGAAVLFGTALTVLFIAGMRLPVFLATLSLCLSGLALALFHSPYRLARLISFRDPWADPYGDGFQLTQSLIAIGRGEMGGVGIGDSVQKLFYLPEAHTDFILAVFAEELGLVGVVGLLVLYVILVSRCFAIGRAAEREGRLCGAYICHGVGVWFALQALVNMGVNMGLLPTKGLTLPLVSYGGSSLVAMCLSLGLVLRVAAEGQFAKSKKPAKPGRRKGEASSAKRGPAALRSAPDASRRAA